ncbi:uncharacterized protein B0H18DRAFT_1038549 [Fomitopsis serialis]|uniref:uncharacterized protein n=1 Tax=Fomitopsis serialis TaxID=139415 RepID=UPI0020073A7D|nr:uncharacterized protein B0H18DRAFT_1038549 [Neoantrodia serialis]KAH9916314.1 hypothetical protein B0H18DRAFT_1038549 [Neoantrodia serialis]
MARTGRTRESGVSVTATVSILNTAVGLKEVEADGISKARFIKKVKENARRAGERFADHKRATTSLHTELEALISDDIFGWDGDDDEVFIPQDTAENPSRHPKAEATHYPHHAQLRELFPPTKAKTKHQRMVEHNTFKSRARKREAEHRASTPAALQFEDGPQQEAPASVRAPVLNPGFVPPTPVSNPRPVRRMDAVREESPSPTVSRQGSTRFNARGLSMQDDEDDQDQDKMDVDEDTPEDTPAGASLFDKGKGVLRRLASAMGAGVPSPIQLFGGYASPERSTPSSDGLVPATTPAKASAPEQVPTPSGSGSVPPMFTSDSPAASPRACWSPPSTPTRPRVRIHDSDSDVRDAQIRELRDRVAQLQARLQAAQRGAAEKDEYIARLEREIAEKQAALEGLVRGIIPAVRLFVRCAMVLRTDECVCSSRRRRSMFRVLVRALACSLEVVMCFVSCLDLFVTVSLVFISLVRVLYRLPLPTACPIALSLYSSALTLTLTIRGAFVLPHTRLLFMPYPPATHSQ